jgi:hypothetical protein
MQVAWNKLMNCFIVSGVYFSSRLLSLLISYAILIGALAASRIERETRLAASEFRSIT